MTKSEILAQFNPSAVGVTNGNLFGFPYTLDQNESWVIPVAWDVTVSYAPGAADGPEAILAASPQLDFYDVDVPKAWEYGVGMLEADPWFETQSKFLRIRAVEHIASLESGNAIEDTQHIVNIINEACSDMVNRVYEISLEALKQKKRVILLGGDHSTPLGYMRAIGETYGDFGILQIDAHADLRKAYEGFTYSHASIMYNALQLPHVTKLVQVGIRDICPEEIALAESDDRISIHHDQLIHRAMYEGKPWDLVCREMISGLPKQVYISFDIDGLDPKLCPNTGTPVPGGLSFQQAMYLIRRVVESGRKIVGFDLCEVAPGEEGDWDANVGARILYRISNLMTKSWM